MKFRMNFQIQQTIFKKICFFLKKKNIFKGVFKKVLKKLLFEKF